MHYSGKKLNALIKKWRPRLKNGSSKHIIRQEGQGYQPGLWS